MNNLLSIKKQLYEKLDEQLNEKIIAIKESMFETSESMKNDTKSSAGDKFETGREMIQQELNNQKGQLDKLLHFKKDLSQIDLTKPLDKVAFGSLVIASNGNYFISAALGKIALGDKDYYALSLASPMGKALKDAKVGDDINFQERTISIIELA